MKVAKTAPAAQSRKWIAPVLLAGILIVLFWKSFLPDYVQFSNDGPLAQQMAAYNQLPGSLTGSWGDLNGFGGNAGGVSLTLNTLFHWVLGPVGYAKFLALCSMFFLGLSAWIFFRQLKLSALASILGGLAAGLQPAWFSNACWGVASQQIAIGMTFFALALIVSNSAETRPLVRWMRLILAGFAVGLNVMEGADNGAIFSLFIAAFVLLRALLQEGKPVWMKLGSGVFKVAVIAVFAGIIAAQSITMLIGSAIVGVAAGGQTGQTAADKAKQWDFATQWSLPKVETLGLFVPGLFGYRMDTPKDAPWLNGSYQGGNYWGAIGRDPAWDRYFADGEQEPAPNSNAHFLRFSGGGNYQGIVLSVIAIWAILQSFRKRDSVFSETQRKFIWFWSAIGLLAILLAWGRFAPFYQLFYALPYSSTIRNPTKFVSVFSWAFLIIFAYGIHGLSRRYLEAPGSGLKSSIAQLQSWWRNVRGFDRRWSIGCGIVFAGSVVAWVIYASQKAVLVKYLQTVEFGKGMAEQIAAFSIAQAGWFLLFLAAAMVLCILILAGIFSGKRAKMGGILLGVLLLADLVRGDMPWIVYWNYPVKYQSNPIVDFLRDKPYEHRVTDLPFAAAPHLPQYDDYWEQLYRIEWIQQLFPYYNIESLDMVQSPRTASDVLAYYKTFAPGENSLYLLARNWELSNNRYFLGPVAIQLPPPYNVVNTLSFLNGALDPEQKRFHIVQRFDIVPKAGIEQIHGLDEMTAETNSDGGCALFEFTGALPRAKLYTDWETNSPAALNGFTTNGLSSQDLDILNSVGTNDFLVLKRLSSPLFDPWQMVLMSDPLPAPPVGTNQNSGTVEFQSYSPKDIKLHTQASTPTVLLLNDKYDPHWRVWIDGKPASLLRANFIMRGVYLPAGEHHVEFYFGLRSKPLYITASAIGIGILLCIGLVFATRRKTTKPAKSS